MLVDFIKIRGARVHNLQNLSVDIPKGKLVVISGLSGSGKSSLAFDTIYAEGQRRYVESLSAYARQFLGLMDKPDVDEISGLSPTIAINQKAMSHNPRSTVGTITEIYDYLRLLYARIGIPHCPTCGREVRRQTVDEIVAAILALPNGKKVYILAPLIRGHKGEHKAPLARIQKAGYARVRFDGTVISLQEAEDQKVDKQKKHDLEVVVDAFDLNPDRRSRIAEAVEAALELGDGLVMASIENEPAQIFSQHFACPVCHVNLPELEPRVFSFNSPYGACPECSGLGTKLEVTPGLVVPNPKLSLAEGAIRPWSRTFANQWWWQEELDRLSKKLSFSLNVSWHDLSEKVRHAVFYGESDGFEGVIPNLERRWRETDSDYIRTEIEKYMRIRVCPTCKGKRLKPEALGVKVGDQSIADIVALTVGQARQWFKQLSLTPREQLIAKQIIREISERLTFLLDVGLTYLTLDRSAATLAGGEAQRIRLATQLGSALSGVIYVLDEPTIGLHYQDTDRLIATLERLRDLGNTVVVVEHDREVIRSADWVIDIGPGAGKDGGVVVGEGTPEELAKIETSPTGRYLSGKSLLPSRDAVRKGNGQTLVIKGARAHNLKNIDVTIPLGTFTAVTGVSGSGKSTLTIDILARALAADFYGAKAEPGAHDTIEGTDAIDKLIHIDQSPIGRTPRSNPATYTGIFTAIRDLYTEVPEAKMKGYRAGRFSFNVKGGRCEACAGEGMVKIEMQFLPDVYVECEQCRGQRYNREALEVHWRGKNIAEVLHQTVHEARAFFEKVPAIADKLETLIEVGLGYLELGQSATTLSGGEAQRIKLATELSRRATGRTLYLLDEPTTGLHFEDTKRLLKVLHALVERGNTVLVIEHNLDVIASADWIIDLGPSGGDAGGELVATGTPETVMKISRSATGVALTAQVVNKTNSRRRVKN